MNVDHTNEDFGWLPFDLTDVGYLIRKHILLLIFVPTIAVAAGVAIVLISPADHVAESVFLVEPNVAKLLRVEYSGSSFTDGETADFLTSLPQTLVSDSALLEVLDFDNSAKSPSDQLPTDRLKGVRHKYYAAQIPETRLIKLAVEDGDSDTAVKISQQLFDHLISRFQQQRLNEVNRTRTELQAQTDIAEQQAREKESQLTAELQKLYGNTAAGQEKRLHEERILKQIATLNVSKAEYAKFAGVVAALDPIDPESSPQQVFQILGVERDSSAAALIQAQANAKTALASIRQTYGPNHAQFRSAATTVTETTQALTKYAAETKQSAANQLETQEQRVKSATEELASLEKKYGEFKVAHAEIRGLHEEVDRAWNTHKSLQTQLMNLNLIPEKVPEFMKQVAGPVVRKFRSKIPLLIAAGVGMFLVIATVFWKNRHGLPFTSRNQSTQYLNVQQVGEFRCRGAADAQDAFAAMENSPELRGAIATSAGLDVIQMTALRQTATVAGLCMSFAGRMAKEGVSTVVITLVENENTSVDDDEYSLEAQGDVRLRLSANLLIDVAAFSRRIKDLRHKYDRIIIDTSELSDNETKTAVAALCDATMIAIDGEGQRPRKAYKEFVDLLKLRGIPTVVTIYLKEPSFKRIWKRSPNGPVTPESFRNFIASSPRNESHVPAV